MRTTKRTGHAELEAFRTRVAEARQRVDKLEGERRKVRFAVQREQSALAAYDEAVEAGERDADPEVEAKLVAAVRDAASDVTDKPIVRGSRIVEEEVVDPRLEARFHGAMRALDEREREVAAFIGERFDDLAQELAADGQKAREHFEAAWREVRKADDEWSGVLRKWQPLLEAGGIEPSDLPTHPLHGLGVGPDAGVPLPMPRSLVPADAPRRKAA